jgi:hypothetical protein
MDLGMDASAKLGLVAAADEEDKLKVWNMYTGNLVKTFSTSSVKHTLWPFPGARESASQLQWGNSHPRVADPVQKRTRCVRFIEDGDGEVSLWANVDGGVVKFAW